MSADGGGLRGAVKRAFLWHWHLLALGAGTGFALLSGQPDAWLALVAAGELAYLGFLGLQPRFQNVLRGKALVQANVPAPRQSVEERARRMAEFLGPAELERFNGLRDRCAALLDLRRAMDEKTGADSADQLRGESLDRMLWLYLKLLHQRAGLRRFLAATSREEMEGELAVARRELEASKQKDAGIESRRSVSIQERARTIEERLANHGKACENLELVTAEIDKTEQQITHLCETGMTLRDSAGLATRIDSISESLRASERAFSQASVDSLLEDDAAPALLTASAVPDLSPPPPPEPSRRVRVRH